MYYLIKWHRGTPTVPPVGAVNVPAENPKIQKIHIFEDFWEHFFLINHIGFSLKYVIPKSSTDFFHRKNELFRIFSIFIFLSYLMPNPCKWHHVTPSRPPVRQKSSFFGRKNTIPEVYGNQLSGDSLIKWEDDLSENFFNFWKSPNDDLSENTICG